MHVSVFVWDNCFTCARDPEFCQFRVGGDAWGILSLWLVEDIAWLWANGVILRLLISGQNGTVLLLQLLERFASEYRRELHKCTLYSRQHEVPRSAVLFHVL